MLQSTANVRILLADEVGRAVDDDVLRGGLDARPFEMVSLPV